MTDEEVYKKALIKFGTDRQIDKMIEEMSELTTALLHFKYGRENNVPEEMADVKIVWRQLEIIFNKNKDIDEWVNIKTSNLERIITNE